MGLIEKDEPAIIFTDSNVVIDVLKSELLHNRTKYFAVKVYYLRQLIKQGEIVVLKINTEDNIANLGTKERFRKLREIVFNSSEYLERCVGVYKSTQDENIFSEEEYLQGKNEERAGKEFVEVQDHLQLLPGDNI